MKVSAVVCIYPPEMYAYFVEAAHKLLAQTYEEFELLIVLGESAAVYERAEADYSGRDDGVLH